MRALSRSIRISEIALRLRELAKMLMNHPLLRFSHRHQPSERKSDPSKPEACYELWTVKHFTLEPSASWFFISAKNFCSPFSHATHNHVSYKPREHTPFYFYRSTNFSWNTKFRGVRKKKRMRITYSFLLFIFTCSFYLCGVQIYIFC